MGFEQIRQLVKTVASEHKTSDQAKRVAIKEVRKHEDFEAFREFLLDCAIRRMVDEARHYNNMSTMRQLRKSIGPNVDKETEEKIYNSTPKVLQGKSESLAEVYELLYNMNIDGRVIPDVSGSEIPELVTNYRASGRTYFFVAEYLSHLQGDVPRDKTIRQAVSPRKMLTAYRRAMHKLDQQSDLGDTG